MEDKIEILIEYDGICEYCEHGTNYFGADPFNCEVNYDCRDHWVCDDCYYNASQEL